MANITKKTVCGVEYTFQKMQAMEFVRLRERCVGDNGRMLDSLYFEELAEHIIVQPKLDLENFEDYAELKEVMEAATMFQLGRKKSAKK